MIKIQPLIFINSYNFIRPRHVEDGILLTDYMCSATGTTMVDRILAAPAPKVRYCGPEQPCFFTVRSHTKKTRHHWKLLLKSCMMSWNCFAIAKPGGSGCIEGMVLAHERKWLYLAPF